MRQQVMMVKQGVKNPEEIFGSIDVSTIDEAFTYSKYDMPGVYDPQLMKRMSSAGFALGQSIVIDDIKLLNGGYSNPALLSQHFVSSS